MQKTLQLLMIGVALGAAATVYAADPPPPVKAVAIPQKNTVPQVVSEPAQLDSPTPAGQESSKKSDSTGGFRDGKSQKSESGKSSNAK
ncbi:MAG: hypothetical protein LBV44_00810 [Methylobacillus sp.]|nr:hypothetical protein [Methylobacillus sp.]